MLLLARVGGKYWYYVPKLILTYVFKSVCICVYMHIYLCLTAAWEYLIVCLELTRIKSLSLTNSRKEAFTRQGTQQLFAT